MALDFQCQFWVNAAREDRVARTKSIENLKDPATGRSLSPGVEYRGLAEYRARKLIEGKRIRKTFETDKQAKEWLLDRKPKPQDLVFGVGSHNSLKVRIGRMITRAGLTDLTFHDLRHEATSRLAKRYPNPMDLRRVTGHLTLKSLDRYYQPDLIELAERS